MLAEARGYRLSLVLAHQHLAQLPRDTQLARHTLPELDEHVAG
jgi:hypothetical protein